MSLLVVGSIGLDTVETPHGRVVDVLGGSASYFSRAAAYFGPVRLVGVVGEDFNDNLRQTLGAPGVDLIGLSVLPGQTFRWNGRYTPDMNDRDTLSVELNVFENFEPILPDSYRDSQYVFLANGSPRTQLSVLEQVTSPRFVVADTMNLWIEIEHAGVWELVSRIDGLVINDSEIRQLTNEHNLIAAAEAVLKRGPTIVVIKKGEHGAVLISASGSRPIPSYPVRNVVDPTGAGDAFAGGLMGYMAQAEEVTDERLHRGLLYATIMASFTIESFSLDRFDHLPWEDIEQRASEFREMLCF